MTDRMLVDHCSPPCRYQDWQLIHRLRRRRDVHHPRDMRVEQTSASLWSQGSMLSAFEEKHFSVRLPSQRFVERLAIAASATDAEGEGISLQAY